MGARVNSENVAWLEDHIRRQDRIIKACDPNFIQYHKGQRDAYWAALFYLGSGPDVDTSAIESGRKISEQLVRADRAEEALREIRNLAHLAWMDKPNIQRIFEMIERRTDEFVR